ncbi:EAL domain-containing protein [Kineosporia sp. NBRC 101731]|uniref:putative bifunctional diguanylate cyclase/phosphodiesterase n=1 Tax=Kineosporia sp. NBRC 101731 TaxID=3032199 RepID=UPI0024A6020F|nr:EAL domain-containing protein [Kineosporia sp. NBRC 101731]GLY30829.1 hypothetical protein Kisp02_41940 [Kineosporia sp. NBRC 101731]
MSVQSDRRFLALVGVLVVTYWLAPDGPVRVTAQLLVGLCAVVAVFTAARADRAHRTGWTLFALGVTLSVAGDATAAWYLSTGHSIPFPSLVDGFNLGAYWVVALSLSRLHGGRRPDIAGYLDTAVLTVAGGLVLWLALAVPLNGGLDLREIVGSVYLITDIVLLGCVVRVWLNPATTLPRATTRSLVLGAGVALIGDTVYGIADGALNTQDRLFESAYLVMYTAWGLAALRAARAARTASTPRRLAFQRMSPARLMTMYAALLVIPAVELVHRTTGVDVDGWATIAASVLLSVLVPARMWVAMGELEASTAQRERLSDDLQHQAAHDALTNLPNRAYLLELTTAALHRARRSGNEVAVLFVDLDYFKRVNDTLGHAAGDEVLQVTADRMRSVLRAGDTLGRQGGDEFVVLIDPVPAPAELMEIANRLVAVVSAPIHVAGSHAVIGASVGIALARDAQVDAYQLLQDADMAAYRAKTNGRGRAEMFDADLRAELAARARLEADIQIGLTQDQFELHYQPVMDVATGRLRGYEALIRWRHPERGLVPPDDFLPTAEQSTLICAIGRWTLNHATRQLVAWTEQDPAGHADATMAVNISGRHLATRALIDEVRQALTDSGLAPRRLVLEITETVLMEEPAADAHLRALREIGVTVSLDDFGTGYTSIGQLQKLQVDTLKIDQSFLHSPDPGTAALVQLMITAAHAFGLDVVAEGVENQEQLDRLAAIGCESAQGYYLGRPAPAPSITAGTGPHAASPA